MTKAQDLVNNIGQTDVVVAPEPVLHRKEGVGREDWAAYNADFLHNAWLRVKEEAEGYLVLEKATFADWEDFCWGLSDKHAQTRYSQWSWDQTDW